MSIFRRAKRGDLQAELPGMPATVKRAGKGDDDARFPQMHLPKSSVTRRSFLARSLAWVNVGIGASLAAIGLGAIGAPALRKSSGQWNPIGRPGEPGPGEPDLAAENTPLLTSFTSLVQDAYMAAAPQHIPVYVINHGNSEFTVFDVRCTHLGCPISWDDKSRHFDCPCHGAIFDETGKVLAGPPPKPLNRYTTKLENGVLFAGPLAE